MGSLWKVEVFDDSESKDFPEEIYSETCTNEVDLQRAVPEAMAELKKAKSFLEI